MHFESASFSTDYSQPNIKIVQFKCISDHKNFIPKYLDIFHETRGSYLQEIAPVNDLVPN